MTNSDEDHYSAPRMKKAAASCGLCCARSTKAFLAAAARSLLLLKERPRKSACFLCCAERNRPCSQSNLPHFRDVSGMQNVNFCCSLLLPLACQTVGPYIALGMTCTMQHGGNMITITILIVQA